MTLEEIYDKIPKIQCQRKCSAYCGVISLSRREHLAVLNIVGQIPDATDLNCPLLRYGACSAYEARPVMCRTWGVSEGIECPHGCKPDRYLTHDEAKAIYVAAIELSHGDERFLHPKRLLKELAYRHMKPIARIVR